MGRRKPITSPCSGSGQLYSDSIDIIVARSHGYGRVFGFTITITTVTVLGTSTVLVARMESPRALTAETNRPTDACGTVELSFSTGSLNYVVLV